MEALAKVCLCIKKKREHGESGEREREGGRVETCVVKPLYITNEKLVVWFL